MNQILWNRPPRSFWSAFGLLLLLWLNGAVVLDVLVTAFSPQSRCHLAHISEYRIGNLQHYPSRCSNESLKSMARSAAMSCQYNLSLFPLCMSTKDSEVDGESRTSSNELQKRFEEAMQRRKKRHAQKISSPSDTKREDFRTDEAKSISPKHEEMESFRVEREGANTHRRSQLKFKRRRNEYLGKKDDAISKSKTRKDKPETNDNKSTQRDARRSSRKDVRRFETDERQSSFDNCYDDYYYDTYSSDSGNVDEMDDSDYDQRPFARSAPTCEWETYQSTSILFPPVTKMTKVGVPAPKAIIHFVGGTFFGSYPRKFYGSLLEDIVTKCNAVVVATPIPLGLPGKGLVNKLEEWMFDEGGAYGQRRRRSVSDNTNNPLDHLSLAETVQKDFNNAYRDVVLDEYCHGHGHIDTQFMKNVPIVGMGHSLGARIQAISCAHPRVSNRYLSIGKGRRLIRSGRSAMIYIGFANWGASSSIPGVEPLDRTVKSRKDQGRDWERDRQKRRSGYRSGARRQYSHYDRDYDVEDLDLSDVFSDVVSSVAKGAKQIGEALTPETENLEFSPTPSELWDDISSVEGWYGQSCRNNLIVQFHDDPIDQGSRLARALLNVYGTGSKSINATTEGSRNTDSLHDVKFARLPGGHLTPVTLQDGIAKFIPKQAVALLSSSYNLILKQLDIERTDKSSQKQQREVMDVADTVASYINSLNSDG